VELLNTLGIDTALGFFGLVLAAIGAFMILAGVGIISIQQVTVKQGRTTWILGVLMALIGAFLLYPDLSAPDMVSDAPGDAVVPEPTVTMPSPDQTGKLSQWKAIDFVIPGNGLWRQENGHYTAIGSQDTIAWSEEVYEGDLELSLDIESSNSFSAASVVLYGNGGSLASGNLIFTIANDLQAILADSIYDDGTYLFSSLGSVDFVEQKHNVLIAINDRQANLFLDGEQIASVFLDENINTSGKIGILKYWEIPDVSFSNIQIRESGSLD
jgi:hypothetical protein